MNRKRKRRMFILIAMACTTFSLLWLPIHVIHVWRVIFSDYFPFSDAMYIIKIVANTLSYLNSCLNPFIYVFVSSKFRKYFFME